MKLWTFYLLGALLTLAFKYIRYLRGSSLPVKKATLEWFFEASAENAISWATSIGVVWVIGVTYIHQIDLMIEWLTAVPLHPAFAFLLGGLAEYAAPNFVKFILSKLPGGGN